jgi:hypothetical protein
VVVADACRLRAGKAVLALCHSLPLSLPLCALNQHLRIDAHVLAIGAPLFNYDARSA